MRVSHAQCVRVERSSPTKSKWKLWSLSTSRVRVGTSGGGERGGVRYRYSVCKSNVSMQMTAVLQVYIEYGNFLFGSVQVSTAT